MVAYKKLSNGERLEICKKMCQSYYANSEVKKKLDEAQSEWQKEVKKDIPEDVAAMVEKYPQSFEYQSYNITLKDLDYNPDTRTVYTQFVWPKIYCEKVVYGFMNGFPKKAWWYSSTDLMSWLLARNSKLYDKIKKEVIPGLKSIDKFAIDLECALESISTLNILKNEMPEAYNVYVSIYGEPVVYCSSKKKNGKSCDNIEKVRALYNSNKSEE